MSCDRPTQRVCNGALPRHAIHRLLTRAAGAFLSHRRLQSSRMTIAGTTASIYTNPPCPIARKTLDTARWEHGKDRWMGDVEFGRTRRFGPAFGPCMAESPGVLSTILMTTQLRLVVQQSPNSGLVPRAGNSGTFFAFHLNPRLGLRFE